ncbi:MAG: NYN domain-containing protein [Pirellulales bacterium]|nr:NYN domain-containing protein [Pirellulales bacterium]
MSLLIDGYNLLNVSGILSRGVGPGSLERSRLALLNFLAASLDPKEIPRTTVVFDAANAPPGLPRKVDYRGIHVHFASRWPDADSLIEELIRQDDSPRQLVVVSSDHRLQRAARRRRAKATDSDVWYARVVRQRRRRQAQEQVQPARPPVPLLEEDVEYWFRQFGGESAFEGLLDEERRREPPHGERRETDEPVERPMGDERKHRDAGLDATSGAYDPFPPGYAEDLEE